MENEINSLEVQENVSNEDIKKLIYTIRGQQVMLDSDVAWLYHYETKNINKAVKRNIERFPADFCFQLTEEEFQKLRFQFGTLNKKVNNGDVTRKYLPYVFKEQGIAMLAGVLKNDIAVKVSINIIKSFIEVRKFISSNGQLFERLTNVEVVILTSQNCDITKLDIKKFNEQYPILKLAKANKFHDRFIVVDNKELYHCGASLKDLGKKCFGINRMEDMEIINKNINMRN